MPVIHYYTRRGCHLCEIMLEELLPLVRGRVEIEIRDVDSSPEWLARYDARVPVIESDGQLISDYPLNYVAVSSYLAGLVDRGQ
jgi:predicted thioredoxin/glutaredoxin